MPHLSALARAYKDTVAFVAIDVYEKKIMTTRQVKTFVDGYGDRMDFNVAAEDTNFTVHDWLEAFGAKDEGIPRTFIINRQGKVAWIGHPKNMDSVLRKIVNNTWDIKKALTERTFNKYLAGLDDEVAYKLHKYEGDYYKLDDLGEPDSALLVINEIVKNEPMLRYTPAMVSFTFSALLRTNPYKAYAYGKEVIVTPTYEDPAYDMIISVIEDDSRKLKIPAEIYRLGAECYQAEIDNDPYPELIDMLLLYHRMAAWYSLAGDSSKAIEAEQKAIQITRISVNVQNDQAVAAE